MKLIRNSLQDMLPATQPNRRHFLAGVAATALTTVSCQHLRQTFALPPSSEQPDKTLKIEAVELIELHGRYTDAAGINGQQQVNPDGCLRRPPSREPYKDNPSGSKETSTSAIYIRIRTSGGIEGLYGPLVKSAAMVVQ